jgi:tetratricopeptide (TPR) repeat protein
VVHPDPVASAEATAARTAFPGLHNPLDSSLVDQAIDTLVSAQTSCAQRRAVWKQLREAGRLDPAITDLERRTASEPRAAEYPTALGQAYLQKCSVIQDVREQGIMAMQADKLFDNALRLDPSNWEARFTKAVALTYWPASMNKGDEIIQHFQILLQQQETQSPQPQFAETYVLLGDQYQKAGQDDEALSIWARGSGLFPNDEKLTKKLATAQ